ncbi:hypothetical protein C0992_010976 [Termitomyces sp. T32_za158]|nr:hypothetical protein C0992_010976 [Termitomyces sp. T32_za158]
MTATAPTPRLFPTLVDGQTYKIVSTESGQVMTLGSITGTVYAYPDENSLSQMVRIGFCVRKPYYHWTLQSQYVKPGTLEGVYLNFEGSYAGARLYGTPYEREWDIEQIPAGAEYKQVFPPWQKPSVRLK